MKTTHILLAAVLAATSAVQAATAEHKLPAPLPEFKTPEQLAKWRQEMTEKAAAADELTKSSSSTFAFFTGKPFVEETGSYAFKFRQYDPELNRWTSADPSGFPDGANSHAYGKSPVSGLDPNGLAWSPIDYVVHFLTGGGQAVGLSNIGYLQGVKDVARGPTGAVTNFGNQIKSYAENMIKPYSGEFHDSFTNTYNFSSVSWPMGDGTLTGYFQGQMTSTPNSDGNGGNYSYLGTATISYFDTFTDPYDIVQGLQQMGVNVPDLLKDVANIVIIPTPGVPLVLQGTPFDILGNWTEQFTGGGPYE